MVLLDVRLLVATATMLAVVVGVDLFCDCRDHGNPIVALHCNDTQAGDTDVTCLKASAAMVPDIPRGYKVVSGSSVVKLYRTFKNWSAAKKSCEADGSRLAVPPDRYAIDGLKPVFAQEKGIWYAFVGSSEDKVEDGLNATLTQIANETGERLEQENCTVLRNDGIMGEAPCHSVSPYLCERRLSTGVPGSYNWEEDAGRFYKPQASRRTRAQAAETCRLENATLAVTDTWRRATVLLRLLEPSTELYFVGFTDHADEGDFVTDSGRHLLDMEFQMWAPDQPDNDDSGVEADCLALSVTGYADVSCDEERLFICEIVPL